MIKSKKMRNSFAATAKGPAQSTPIGFSFYQAQPKLLFNWAELAILSLLNSHPPSNPPTRPPKIVSKCRIRKFIFSKQAYFKVTRWHLIGKILAGRRPQFFCKWKTTSIYFVNEKQPQFTFPMEDDLNSICILKTTFFFINIHELDSF